MKGKMQDEEEFANEYKQKALEVGAMGGGGGGRGGHPWGPRRWKQVPAGTLTQPQCNEIKPPGSEIWRTVATDGWRGWMPPFRRCSTEPSKIGGSSRDAQLSVLKNTWEQYMMLHGRDVLAMPTQLAEIRDATNHCQIDWKSKPVPKKE